MKSLFESISPQPLQRRMFDPAHKTNPEAAPLQWFSKGTRSLFSLGWVGEFRVNARKGDAGGLADPDVRVALGDL